MSKLIKFKSALLYWGALLVVMLCTNPTELPVAFLILPYGLLFGAIFYTNRIVIRKIAQDTHTTITEVRTRHASFTLAACGVLFVALQSIGQLTVRDVVVVVLLLTLGFFYVNRNRARQK